MKRLESALFGTLFITVTEFTVGIFDNLIMGWKVWDYTDVRGNWRGQICLPFSILWLILCISAAFPCSAISQQYHGKSCSGIKQ